MYAKRVYERLRKKTTSSKHHHHRARKPAENLDLQSDLLQSDFFTSHWDGVVEAPAELVSLLALGFIR